MWTVNVNALPAHLGSPRQNTESHKWLSSCSSATHL